LIGKGKVEVVPNVDCGDYVVVTNSDEVITYKSEGDQEDELRHSGYLVA
jgi:ribosomal protein L13